MVSPAISKTDMPCDPPIRVYEVNSSFNDFNSQLLLLEVEHLTDRTSNINERERPKSKGA